LLGSAFSFQPRDFGLSSDKIVLADDGDGKADITIFCGGARHLQRSEAGFTGVAFGATSDKPMPIAFV